MRYLKGRTRAADLAALLGLAAVSALAIPLFRHNLLFNPRLVPNNGTTVLDVSPMGMLAATIPGLFVVWSLVIFIKNRRRLGEPFMA